MHHENRYINQNNENMCRSRTLVQPQAAFPAAGKCKVKQPELMWKLQQVTQQIQLRSFMKMASYQ